MTLISDLHINQLTDSQASPHRTPTCPPSTTHRRRILTSAAAAKEFIVIVSRLLVYNYCSVRLLLDIIIENEFKSFYTNHYPIPLTLGIRQAQRYTTSLQVDFAT